VEVGIKMWHQTLVTRYQRLITMVIKKSNAQYFYLYPWSSKNQMPGFLIYIHGYKKIKCPVFFIYIHGHPKNQDTHGLYM
jgi:hypothetical protein